MDIEDSVIDIMDEAMSKVEALLENLPRVRTDDLGMDRRGGKVWVDLDNGQIIVSDVYRGGVEYYCGFQYVGDDDKAVYGKYTVYLDSNERVAEAVTHFEEMQGEGD